MKLKRAWSRKMPPDLGPDQKPCARCGRPLAARDPRCPGRRKKFCSKRCRQNGHRWGARLGAGVPRVKWIDRSEQVGGTDE